MQRKIWNELSDMKFGDEYLTQYIKFHRLIRHIFKIITIIFSASGIWFALRDWKIPLIFTSSFIAIVQVLTSVESYIVHTEKKLEELGYLRIMYHKVWNKLEKLYMTSPQFTEVELIERFYEIRADYTSIEEADNKLGIRTWKRLSNKAEVITNKYLENV